MLRRLAPYLLLLAAFLMDTALLPVLYYGRYLVPLTLVVVILTGIQLGRVQGIISGLISGFLLDVTAGSLGIKLFPYVLIGFLVGFFLDQQPQIDRSMTRRDRFQLLMVRIIWISVLLLLHEIVLLVYQYFHTAVFEWAYVRDVLIRVILTTALCLVGYAPFRALCFGSARSGAGRDSREVKTF